MVSWVKTPMVTPFGGAPCTNYIFQIVVTSATRPCTVAPTPLLCTQTNNINTRRSPLATTDEATWERVEAAYAEEDEEYGEEETDMVDAPYMDAAATMTMAYKMDTVASDVDVAPPPMGPPPGSPPSPTPKIEMEDQQG